MEIIREARGLTSRRPFMVNTPFGPCRLPLGPPSQNAPAGHMPRLLPQPVVRGGLQRSDHGDTGPAPAPYPPNPKIRHFQDQQRPARSLLKRRGYVRDEDTSRRHAEAMTTTGRARGTAGGRALRTIVVVPELAATRGEDVLIRHPDEGAVPPLAAATQGLTYVTYLTYASPSRNMSVHAKTGQR